MPAVLRAGLRERHGAPSPLWLQYRLEAIGLNPINNIVDVTNYVMAELAQPMHAFDADKLDGDTIFVRSARAGEQAPGAERRELRSDSRESGDRRREGPIAIAGVIGGRDSAIGESTTRIVLESANFQAASIRKTSVALKLRTDASMRFEKAQDPVNTMRGLARALALLEEVSPGIRLVGGVADKQSRNQNAAADRAADRLAASANWAGRCRPRKCADSRIARIRRHRNRAGDFSVTVPSWRATKDISIKDDLVEEVGRMVGYDSITPAPPLVRSHRPA